MIKLENTEVVGWEHAIRGMRNPKNSWDRSDSKYECPYKLSDDGEHFPYCGSRLLGPSCKENMCVGPNDHKLMMQLAKGGPVHAKYRRMIVVYVDITAPLYWWKEFDTYKVGTVANSCSTMHKIGEKEFTMSDFSHDHLIGVKGIHFVDDDDMYEDGFGNPWWSANLLSQTICTLNFYREKWLNAKVKPMKEESKRAELVKRYWWQMIQLLPSSYMQKRTVMMNYEVLANIYRWRNPHKMDVGHWDVVIDWIESLPYSEIITGGKDDES